MSKILCVEIEPDLLQQVTEDAFSRGSSVNDVAVGILADHYGVQFEPTGRRASAASGAASKVTLRMPRPLWNRLHDLVRDEGGTKRTLVERALAAYYAAAAA